MTDATPPATGPAATGPAAVAPAASAPATSHPDAPATTKALQQFVYTGVSEEQRPILVADLWHAGALRVEVVRDAGANPATYTVTATFPA